MTDLDDLGPNTCHSCGRPDVIQPDGSVPPHDVLGLASPCDAAPSICSANARIVLLRHTSAPFPMGCRWCGTTHREHGQRWVPGHGIHGWAEPTRQQIEARMRVRFGARQSAKVVIQ